MFSKLSEFSYMMLNISSIINTSFGMVNDRMFLLLFLFLQKFSCFCSLQAWWKMLMKFVYPISSFIQILYLCKFKIWGRFSLIIIYYVYGKLDNIFFFWNCHVFLPDKFYSYRQKKSLPSLENFPSLYSFLFGVLAWGEWFGGDKPGSNKLGEKWENFSILSEIWKRQQIWQISSFVPWALRIFQIFQI